jgi:hypothetical protein
MTPRACLTRFAVLFLAVWSAWTAEAQSSRLKIYLINAQSNSTVRELNDGTSISLDELKDGISTILVQHPSPAQVGKVEFFTGPQQTRPVKIEKRVPFVLYGDRENGTKLNGSPLTEGEKFLKVRVFGRGTHARRKLAEVAIRFSVTPSSSPSGGAGSPSDGVDTPSADITHAEGLAAWRSTESSGASCASCHSPDGYDLAMIAFSDEHIRRRATPHVGPQAAVKIAQFIRNVRTRYGIINPPDPRSFRPFQPGGEVIQGATSVERDERFGAMLRDQYKLRVSQPSPITSLSEALKVRDEMLALDIKRLKIGIPFNRWSEDGFHGAAHDSIADWIPNSPRVPLAGKEGAWLALQDTYIQSPTDQNFWTMYNAIGDHTKLLPLGGDRLFRDKYKSLLLAQHLFRKARLEGLVESDALNFFEYTLESPTVDGGKIVAGVHNPMWDVGDTARVHNKGSNDCTGTCLNMVPALYQALTVSHSMRDQMSALRLPWMWLGWFFDQGMQRTSGSNSTKGLEYFRQALLDGSVGIPELPIDESKPSTYPIHAAFVFLRKQLVQSFEPTALEERARSTQPLIVGFNEFHRFSFDRTHIPKTGDHAALYKHFVCNAYLTTLFLLDDHQAKGKTVESRWRENVIGNGGNRTGMLKFLEDAGPSCAGNFRPLADRILKRS